MSDERTAILLQSVVRRLSLLVTVVCYEAEVANGPGIARWIRIWNAKETPMTTSKNHEFHSDEKFLMNTNRAMHSTFSGRHTTTEKKLDSKNAPDCSEISLHLSES